ncbi:hypothetical protein N8987_06840 [Crocinitomix sp.]|nr:hypothetical protein [Crocinitomix sp.]
MYDRINMWLGKDSVSGVDLLAETSCYLDKATEETKDGNTSISGSLNNLIVKIYDTGISIKGSPAKYYLGDNFKTLTRQDTEHCIEKLSDTLKLPIKDAKPTKMDLAQTFIVNHPPTEYYSLLGNSQYYDRLEQPNSLYYSNGNRTKLFYDKKKEGKKRGLIIPEVWIGQNVLRYEYRLTQRANTYLGFDYMKVEDLYQEDTYIKFIDQYISEFENITKNREIQFNLDNCKSPKDFMKQLQLKAINEIGQTELINMVEHMRKRETFDKPEYYSRLKKELIELCNKPNHSEPSLLIEELTNKIKAVRENYR